MDGVWLVDKPGALSSHDVVARARRLLKTRAIGHAGTLDPMATGLLVLLVGEATKLSPFLTSEQKRYRTTLTLGAATDSLDADGVVTLRAPIPEALRAELALGAASPLLARVVESERARSEQLPPAISAIHVDGERAYERARRGEEVTLPPRPVLVESIELLAVDADADSPTVTFELAVSKGYYVRSFGRDVGEALGVPAHLSALRRLRSGAFDVADASALGPEPALLSLTDAVRRALPAATLSERGVHRARCGQPLDPDDFVAPPPPAGHCAWLDGEALIAIGEPTEGRFRVVRGFRVGALNRSPARRRRGRAAAAASRRATPVWRRYPGRRSRSARTTLRRAP